MPMIRRGTLDAFEGSEETPLSDLARDAMLDVSSSLSIRPNFSRAYLGSLLSAPANLLSA